MVTSELQAAEPLTLADVAGGLALSDAAGWNQTVDDWALFIEEGRAIGCRDPEGRLIATAAALPYGAGVGWVSMVLVDAAFRHRGLASALLGDCVDWLRGAGRVPVLDATPAGAEVYRRLGFVGGFELARWEGTGSGDPASDPPPGARPNGAIVETILAVDALATGIARGAVLRSFLARPTTRACRPADGSGYVIARAGRRATQLGPLVAASEDVACELLAAALAGCADRVFIDVPTHRPGIADWLAQRGFTRQRSFLRMALGPTPALALGERIFAVAGPEFG